MSIPYDITKYDMYTVDGEDFEAVILVDWHSGEIRETSPYLRAFVGDSLGSFRSHAAERGWGWRLVPHKGHEAEQEDAMKILRKTRWK